MHRCFFVAIARGPFEGSRDSRKLAVSAWRTQPLRMSQPGIDTALCAEEAPPALASEVLFDLDFVCLVGSAPQVRTRRFTLKQYLHFSHWLKRQEVNKLSRIVRSRSLARNGVSCSVFHISYRRHDFIHPADDPFNPEGHWLSFQH
jgi:hypothetical protein